MAPARLLIAGLPAGLAAWLEQRLDGVAATSVEDAAGLRAQLAMGGCHLVVLTPDLLAGLRQRPAEPRPPVLCCLGPSSSSDPAVAASGWDGRVHLLGHPLDREELARRSAALLGLRLRPDPVAQGALDGLWRRFRGANLERVALLEEAARAAVAGRMSDDLRQRARSAAHKLAGSVGTFGFVAAGRRARQVEQRLEGGAPLAVDDGRELARCIAALRRELEGGEPAAAAPMREGEGAAAPATALRLLVVDDDDVWAASVIAAAVQRGFAASHRHVAAVADGADGATAADVALVDPDAVHGLEALTRLTGRTPPVPVVVASALDRLPERLAVARHGGGWFLRKPLDPAQALDAVERVLRGGDGVPPTVLAVDDDPQVLATLRALLAPLRVRLATLEDPLRLWDRLAQVAPDLLVLDVDMPQVGGVDLCRAVRNDPRWATLPIVFLTAHDDAETVRRVFSAGADDFVSKPIVGPEVVTRVTNRLERARLLRRLAETDPLTGLANRRHGEREMERQLHLAGREGRPLSLAVIDIDRFKAINDRFGHSVGDTVLCGVAALFGRGLRAEDVAVRWGGDEFVVCLYGITGGEVLDRLAGLLDELRGQVFRDGRGAGFAVSLTGGVAQFPEDAADLSGLFRAADAALLAAKEAGRGRFLAANAGQTATESGPALEVDIVLAGAPELAAGLERGCGASGLSLRCLPGAVEACRLLTGVRPAVKPRALLLDLHLPGGDALELLRRLAADGALRRTRVLALGTLGDERPLLASLDLGACDYAVPALGMPLLLNRLARLLAP